MDVIFVFCLFKAALAGIKPGRFDRQFWSVEADAGSKSIIRHRGLTQGWMHPVSECVFRFTDAKGHYIGYVVQKPNGRVLFHKADGIFIGGTIMREGVLEIQDSAGRYHKLEDPPSDESPKRLVIRPEDLDKILGD